MSVEPFDRVEFIVNEILSSPKYRAIHPGLVRRLAASELTKRRSLKELEKAVKNKLHQVGGAYFPSTAQYASWRHDLEQAACGELLPWQAGEFQALCRKILVGHNSTRERLPVLGEFYATIFRELPPVRSILDVACGFNPVALPWMSYTSEMIYHGLDIYSDLVDFLNHFFRLCKVNGTASWADVLDENTQFSKPAEGKTCYDLALVLKALPCLDQIEKGAGIKLMRRLPARFLLVTYPAYSLGGRQKGMPDFYADAFNTLLANAFPEGVQSVRRFDFPTELAFLIETSIPPFE